MAIYYNRSAPAGCGVTEKGQLVQIPPGYTRQNDEYLPAKTGSNVPPPPSGFITVPNEQVGSYSTNDYDINKQNFYNESTGVGGVTVSVRKIPKTTLVSPSGQRIIARTDNVKGTSVPPADEYLRSGFSTEKAPGIPSGNTQSRGVGFEDLSRRSYLILPSGQHISAQDPNYSIYANQPCVKAYEAPKTSASSPVAPTDLGGTDTTGLPPYMV